VSTHNAKRKLAEHSQQPEEFLNKYDELKSKKYKYFCIYYYDIFRTAFSNS